MTFSSPDKFRHHISDFLYANSPQKAAFYLLLFLKNTQMTQSGFLSLCDALNIHTTYALTIDKPFMYYFVKLYIHESTAVPSNYLNFDMAKEICELLFCERHIDTAENVYIDYGFLTDELPSRDFALELCLPSPLFKEFRLEAEENPKKVADTLWSHPFVVEERLSLPDLPPVEIENIIQQFCRLTKQRITIGSGINWRTLA